LVGLPCKVFFSRQLTSSRPAQQICHANHCLQLILREFCGGSLQHIRDLFCLRNVGRKVRSAILNLPKAVLEAISLIETHPGIFQLLDLFGAIAPFDLVLPSIRAIHNDILEVSWLVRN